ncbi:MULTISPECIES: hypothetical protein [Thermomonosporaceae]|uniref:hypothetical protein n=1 Tax=Thermomonosporaceae TaxID=2012 RepID=UPI00255AA329|nr:MULTISPECIES: hypothetical protein [Thermomonosporaceae]MDL4775582.1 hypothetical protein [Actinomadura xylanilytica]
MSVDQSTTPRRPPIPRKKKPARRSMLPALKRIAALGWPLAVALALLLAGLATADWADRRSAAAPSSNRALLDKGDTAKVIADVSGAVARVFTYAYTDPAATERAAATVLTGRAASQYASLFGQVKAQAPVQQLALTTKVSRAGLSRLTRDGRTAVLVVFLDQTATRKGKAAGPPIAAQLVVTARHDDHGWRISDLRAA